MKSFIIAVNDGGLQFHRVDETYIEKYTELYQKKIYFIVEVREFIEKLVKII